MDKNKQRREFILEKLKKNKMVDEGDAIERDLKKISDTKLRVNEREFFKEGSKLYNGIMWVDKWSES